MLQFMILFIKLSLVLVQDHKYRAPNDDQTYLVIMVNETSLLTIILWQVAIKVTKSSLNLA